MFPKIKAKIKGLSLSRWRRHALGGVLFAGILLSGVLLMRSSDEAAPEPAEAVTTDLEFASSDPLAAPVPIRDSEPSPEEDLAAFPSTLLDEGGLLEPMEPSTHWDAPAATELLAIETSASDDGQGSLIHLRANGSISNAEVSALVDPDRLVIDLPGLVSAMESSRLNVDSPRVARVRVGQHEGKVRVVLDSGSDAEGFEDRLVEPAPDGLRVILGSPQAFVETAPTDPTVPLGSDGETDGLLAETEGGTQPVASIASPDSSEPVQPAPKEAPFPLYLMGSKASAPNMATGVVLEDRYDCIIEPFRLVEVGSALTAIVESVSVERADFVEEGQVLAQLEASAQRATVAAASARAKMDGDLQARRARMELGGRKRKRAEHLFESQALSADLRDEISTEAQVAKAVVHQARERKELMEFEYQEAIARLNEHTIRSPVSGVVVDRLKSPGEVVKEETIMVIAQIDPLRVEVILPAAVFGSIRPGMRAEVIPELPNAGVQVASVTVVDRVVDATSGTFGVRLKLPNSDFAVPSGLRCQVRFLQVD